MDKILFSEIYEISVCKMNFNFLIIYSTSTSFMLASNDHFGLKSKSQYILTLTASEESIKMRQDVSLKKMPCPLSKFLRKAKESKTKPILWGEWPSRFYSCCLVTASLAWSNEDKLRMDDLGDLTSQLTSPII